MLHNEQKQQAALQKGLPVFYYYSSDPFLARAAAEKTAAALLREEGESTRLDGPAPTVEELSLIHISEPTRLSEASRMPSSA